MKWERKEMRDVEWNGQIHVTLQLFTFLFSIPFWFNLSVHYLCPKMQETKTHTLQPSIYLFKP